MQNNNKLKNMKYGIASVAIHSKIMNLTCERMQEWT